MEIYITHLHGKLGGQYSKLFKVKTNETRK